MADEKAKRPVERCKKDVIICSTPSPVPGASLQHCERCRKVLTVWTPRLLPSETLFLVRRARNVEERAAKPDLLSRLYRCRSKMDSKLFTEFKGREANGGTKISSRKTAEKRGFLLPFEFKETVLVPKELLNDSGVEEPENGIPAKTSFTR